MRVGIDYLPAVTHEWGLGRYARELVRALRRLPDVPSLSLLEFGAAPRRVPYKKLGLERDDVPESGPDPTVPDKARLRRIPLRIPRRFGIKAIRRLGLQPENWAGPVQLFHHIQAPYVHVRRARQVLSLAQLPQSGSAEEAELARFARNMDALLVFSDAFGREVVERLELDAGRVWSVPVGCDHWRRETLGARIDRSGPPQFLVLGAVHKERAPARIVSAFERLLQRGREARLEFVGHPGTAADELEAVLRNSPASAALHWERSPADSAMPQTMARSDVLVHLTRTAGTPITPLEACASGASVVATRLPVFEQVLGPHAHWLAPEDGDERLSELMTLAYDTREDQEARRARIELARGYSWERHARETLALWRELCDSTFESPLRAPHAP